METKVRPFNVNKTFGIDVLLKLTKARLSNIYCQRPLIEQSDRHMHTSFVFYQS